MSQRTRNTYDIWAATYDQDANPQIFLEHDDVLNTVNAIAGEIILDAACGTGKYAIEFERKGAKVIGLDFSEAMLEKARSKSTNIEWVIADLTKQLPFPSRHFDKINCAQAVKHIKELGPVFIEFYRVLKVGGRLFFSVSHPEMTWDGYDLAKPVPEVAILSQSSDKYDYSLDDYLVAIRAAGLTFDSLLEVPVSEKIKHFLTEAAFPNVKGRKQIAVFSCTKK